MNYEKKVIYLSYMEKDVKIKSAGYIRIEVRDQLFAVDMHVNAKRIREEGQYEINAESEKDSVPMGEIFLENGEGIFQGKFPMEEIGKDGKVLSYQEIEAFRVPLGENRSIWGGLALKKPAEIKRWQPEAVPEMKASEKPQRSFGQPHNEDVRKKLEEVRLTPGKWQQLLKSYKQVRPYGDERIYIAIEPKDFVIMSGEYQHLAHNSFLLHGFYNYRHVILGTENDMYYLGVPGVYYEREKMVAMMFGFEAFECEGGKAENGKFGYYLKRIKI